MSSIELYLLHIGLILQDCNEGKFINNVFLRIQVWRAQMSRHLIKITDGLEISYIERKGKINEKTIIFLHGFSGDSEMFCDITRLLPDTLHVVAIDLPGHGQSKPNDEKGDYRISSKVENLHKVKCV